jgi:beta-lactamase superfamily II metal-dependent hydrolase
MSKKACAVRYLVIAFFGIGVALAQASRSLDIYTIDVEGGNATLFVAPSGESLLIDTGNALNQAPRDAARIMEAVQAAGLKQIDHLIITHWHGDHFGGLQELALKIPIKEFIDHGPNVQPGELADTFLAKTYPQIIGSAKHTVAKPGDKIAIAGLGVQVVASAGKIIANPLPGSQILVAQTISRGKTTSRILIPSPFSSPMGIFERLTWATSQRTRNSS